MGNKAKRRILIKLQEIQVQQKNRHNTPRKIQYMVKIKKKLYTHLKETRQRNKKHT